jgi:hypothetical protein
MTPNSTTPNGGAQLQAVQEQARRLGLFPNDRDLLARPNCGLTEDVLASGGSSPVSPLVIRTTACASSSPTKDDGPFVCPACGAAPSSPQALRVGDR